MHFKCQNTILRLSLIYHTLRKSFFAFHFIRIVRQIKPVELYFAVQEPGPVREGIHANLETVDFVGDKRCLP